MEFSISAEAQADLESIWRYTFEEWSFDQANRYIGLIMDEIDFLCIHPNTGVDYGTVRKGYFKARAQSHLIFYRINKSENRLEIIRILHQRMDIDDRLKG